MAKVQIICWVLHLVELFRNSIHNLRAADKNALRVLELEDVVAKLETVVEKLEANVNAQKQLLTAEKLNEISRIQADYKRAIDDLVIRYEGPSLSPYACACHDRSCCVAEKCQRRVRYRAADGQGFCGACFVKRNAKEFTDLKPVQPRPLRKTATVFPALSTDSSDRTSNLLVTKDNFSE